MKIGKRVEQLIRQRQKIRKIEADLKDEKEKFARLEREALAEMEELEVDSARCGLGTATVKKAEYPQISDPESFYKFVRRRNDFELLHRRISSNVWRQRVEERKGKPIPGVSTYLKTSLLLREPSKG